MRRIICFLLVIGVWLAGRPAEAIVLRYELKKGDIARFKEMAAAAALVSINIAGQTQTQQARHSQTATYKEEVTDVTSEGVIILVRALESGSMTAEVGGEQGKVSRPLPEMRTFIRMTPRGQVLSARTTFAPQQGAAAPQAPPGFNIEDLGVNMGTLEAVLSHLPFPEKDLQPNDTWSEQIRLPGFLGSPATTINLNSRLLALGPYKGRDCAKIRTSFEIPLEIDLQEIFKQMPLPEGAEVQMEMKGKIAGRVEWQFDYKQGLLVYAEGPMQVAAKASFSFTGPQGESMSGQVNITMKMNTKTTLLEKK